MKFKLFLIGRISVILFFVGVGICFLFNKGDANPKLENDELESIATLANEDFVIKDNYNNIELGGKYGDLKTNDKIIEIVPANENHIYDIYVFENFKIISQPGGDADSIIGSIDLTTLIIQTPRGISVGDNIQDVVEKYGKPDESSKADSIAPGQYVYQYDGKYITFFVDETGKVVLIRFEIA